MRARAELREAIGLPNVVEVTRRPVTLMMAMIARLTLVGRGGRPPSEMPAKVAGGPLVGEYGISLSRSPLREL